jgi:hypothetical protein
LANLQLNQALVELDEKLRSLNAFVEANQFLVETLREQEAELRQMEPEETRAVGLDNARAIFGSYDGHQGNPEVLELLEDILAPKQTAQIIPFPKRG